MFGCALFDTCGIEAKLEVNPNQRLDYQHSKYGLLLNRRNALARRALSKQGDGPTSSPLLSSARVALAAGRQSEARAMLESVLELTPDAEGTWLLLADAVDTIPERRFCFQQVMMLEPENGTAKRELEVLGFGLAWSPLVDYVTLPQRETGTQLPRWLKNLRSFVSSKIALLAVVYLVALVTA